MSLLNRIGRREWTLGRHKIARQTQRQLLKLTEEISAKRRPGLAEAHEQFGRGTL